ncbi:MAG: PhnD/SsuA/transferrin family substrate-binding protein [SAR324 cluster bacterium]|nr:PhnD/SsuA/transferrin family substrate-binding protein [SAR324 cluster bacterium]
MTSFSNLYAALNNYKIGVLAKRGPEITVQKWSATADYLSEKLPNLTFTIVPLGFEEVPSAVANKTIDFLLVNPSIYVEMEILHGASRIATLKNKGPNGAYTLFGGVLLARADRQDIQTMGDLRKGKSFMAVKETSLGGFQLGWSELKKYGIDPYQDFTKLSFRSKHDLVVFAVLNGEVDVGTIRSDTLERMAEEKKINLDDFKIIGKKRVTDGVEFPYRHSTILVPEWPFAKLSHVPDFMAQKVAIALLEMPKNSMAAINGKNEGWTVPLNYQPIRNLMIDLKIGPFRKFGQLTFGKIMKQYWLPLAISSVLLLFLSGVLAYILKINGQLKHSQALLRVEAVKKTKVEEALEAQRDELEAQVAQVQETFSHLEKIKKYHDLTSYLFTTSDPIDLLQKALDRVVGLSSSELGAIFLWNEDTKNLDARVFHALDPASISDSSLAGSLPAQVLADGKARVISELPVDCFFEINLGITKLFPAELVMLPMQIKDKPLGVIVLGSLNAYPEEDIPVLSHMSDQVSILLDNALTYEKVAQSTKDLVEANETKDKFFSIISHDLKGPLGSMALIFSLVRRESLTLDDDLIITLEKQTNHIHQLLTDLLNWAQSQKKQMITKRSIFTLIDLTKDAVNLLSESAQQKNITILTEELDSYLVQADKFMISTVVRNLISNAIKFTPEGGSIVIRTQVTSQNIRLEIVDSGIGMSEKQRDSVFKLDKPMSSTLGTANEKGTGLGLILCKEFIVKNAGKIGVESKLGEGSTFWISLPRSQKVALAAEALLPLADLKIGPVLLVEDNPLHLKTSIYQLSQMGLDFDIAKNGEDALDLAQTKDYDLILMDIDLPKINGIEVSKALRAKGKEAKIIVLSSYSQEELEDKFHYADFDNFLNKPLEAEVLTGTLRELFA